MLKPRDFLAMEVSLSWNYCGGCLSESFGMYIVMLNPQMSMVGHAMIYKVIICWWHVITNRLKKTVKWITFLKPNLTMKPLFPTLTNQTLALPGSLTNKSNQNKTKPLSMLSLFVVTQPPPPLLPSIPVFIVYKFISCFFRQVLSRGQTSTPSTDDVLVQPLQSFQPKVAFSKAWNRLRCLRCFY